MEEKVKSSFIYLLVSCITNQEKHSLWDSITAQICARHDATKRGQPNTTTTSLQGKLEERRITYPKGTFEALLVVAVDWCYYLQELQDALLIVQIGYLLKRLLNQLTKSFSLR